MLSRCRRRREGRFAIPVLAFALTLASSVGCASGSGPKAQVGRAATRGPVEFSFVATDGQRLSAASTRGRVTMLLFVTTFDLGSQVMAKHLDEALATHVPRTNAGAIVLEAPRYALLAEAFKSSLRLSYPVALAGMGHLALENLGTISTVPTLVVLDRRGRVVWTKVGVFGIGELRKALARASAH